MVCRGRRPLSSRRATKIEAIIIGNSDGIGLGLTRELLKRGWKIRGLSKSESPLSDPSYEHVVVDVRDARYPEALNRPVELCIYCAGIGELLDPEEMSGEAEIFQVNLLGMVTAASVVLPMMVEKGRGQFLGLSSVADEILSPEAPSYHASKAGFSNYLEGLALALRPKGVHVTNVRFGFVDTKMAKGDVRPFMMSVERAVKHLLTCIEKKPVRYTAPWIVVPLVKLRAWMLRLKT